MFVPRISCNVFDNLTRFIFLKVNFTYVATENEKEKENK